MRRHSWKGAVLGSSMQTSRRISELCIRGPEPSVDQSQWSLEGQELLGRGVYVSYALTLGRRDRGRAAAQRGRGAWVQPTSFAATSAERGPSARGPRRDG